MAPDTSVKARRSRFEGLEQELTEHLDRAHELGERAQRSNGMAQEAIDRAMEIANQLRVRVFNE